jgi:hypothetical protein
VAVELFSSLGLSVLHQACGIIYSPSNFCFLTCMLYIFRYQSRRLRRHSSSIQEHRISNIMHMVSHLLLLLAISLVAYTESINENPLSSLGRPRLARHILKRRGYRDFILHNLFTHTYYDAAGEINLALTCKTTAHIFYHNSQKAVHWTDPNSATSTCCTTSWKKAGPSAGYPEHYIFCDSTGSTEVWQWYLSSYTDGGAFTLQLSHTYEDPT